MKKTLAVFAISAALATPALASGPTDPIVAPEVIMTAAAESSTPSAPLVLGLTTVIVFSVGLAN
ncbi:MAG: hypothetical protein N4A53_01720 [Pelagimonas sp.]|jgi:hypothetical protein|nr:hypothetical protein [Pelagimonas sp.]